MYKDAFELTFLIDSLSVMSVFCKCQILRRLDIFLSDKLLFHHLHHRHLIWSQILFVAEQIPLFIVTLSCLFLLLSPLVLSTHFRFFFFFYPSTFL